MTDDAFDVDDLFENAAQDWPHNGPETVRLTNVTVRPHETFTDIYNAEGQQVPFDEARAYKETLKSGGSLPAGFEEVPQVEVVLNQVVPTSRSLQEPQYPPTIGIGNLRKVRIAADQRSFQFIDTAGNPRNIKGESWLRALVRDLAKFSPEFRARAKAGKLIDPDNYTIDLTAFEGIEAVWDSAKLPIPNNRQGKTKNRAWPVGSAGVNTPAVATTPQTTVATVTPPAEDFDVEGFLRTAASTANTPEAFRIAVLQKGIQITGAGRSDLLAQVNSDPAGVLNNYLADTIAP